jgi:hypothetical protein
LFLNKKVFFIAHIKNIRGPYLFETLYGGSPCSCTPHRAGLVNKPRQHALRRSSCAAHILQCSWGSTFQTFNTNSLRASSFVRASSNQLVSKSEISRYNVTHINIILSNKIHVMNKSINLFLHDPSRV